MQVSPQLYPLSLTDYLDLLAEEHEEQARVEALELFSRPYGSQVMPSPSSFHPTSSRELLTTHGGQHDRFRSRPQRHSSTLQAPPTTTTPPRASASAISRLPRARVMPHDKVLCHDDARSCGVCCDRLVDGVALFRMPCGHIYHVHCIVPWLNQSCTCPECRYEIATNDPAYEIGRRERMKARKVVSCPCYPSGVHSCFFAHPANVLGDDGRYNSKDSDSRQHCEAVDSVQGKV